MKNFIGLFVLLGLWFVAAVATLSGLTRLVVAPRPVVTSAPMLAAGR